jgi:hypothetical protein
MQAVFIRMLQGVAVALILTLSASEATAQAYMQSRCQGIVATPRFDHATHAAWYRRFWTGQCGDLFLCQAGSPSWNELVPLLRARAPAGKADAVTRRTCLVGQRIGLEWARDNSVRRIDTEDLRRFMATVQDASDVEAGLTSVEQSVSR